jgi:hypothetical protein
MKKSKTIRLADRKMYWAVYMTKKYRGSFTFEQFVNNNPQIIGLDGYKYSTRRCIKSKRKQDEIKLKWLKY